MQRRTPPVTLRLLRMRLRFVLQMLRLLKSSGIGGDGFQLAS